MVILTTFDKILTRRAPRFRVVRGAGGDEQHDGSRAWKQGTVTRDVLYRSQRFSFLDIFLGSSRNVVLLCEFWSLRKISLNPKLYHWRFIKTSWPCGSKFSFSICGVFTQFEALWGTRWLHRAIVARHMSFPRFPPVVNAKLNQLRLRNLVNLSKCCSKCPITCPILPRHFKM